MRLRKISYYVAAFLIPAFIQIFVFACMGFYPFGDKVYIGMGYELAICQFFLVVDKNDKENNGRQYFL